MIGIRENILLKCARLWTSINRDLFHARPLIKNTQWSEDVVPTVAFNMRVVKKGNVTMKVWDVAGELLSLLRELVI